LITSTYTLDEVAKGYEDMHAGKNIRGVVLFD
jgi:S-(hydroxymethyl)glutathione dehydrogenase/alcohol dehydrogenase